MSPSRERRRATRVACQQPVQLQHGGLDHPISALAEDISATGLRIAAVAAVAPFKAGQRVLCSVLLQDRPVEAACRVVWVEPGAFNQQPVAGLEFEELSTSEQTLLQRFISRLTANLKVGALVFDPCCSSGTWAPEYLIGEDTVEQPPPQRRQPLKAKQIALAAGILLAGALASLLILQATLF